MVSVFLVVANIGLSLQEVEPPSHMAAQNSDIDNTDHSSLEVLAQNNKASKMDS